jgi:hypothetical protein
MKRLPNKLQKGQALLIVLLGMAVALTMILSVVSRSVTDIQLTSRDEETQRAFSAAEAGVEQVLLTGQTSSGEVAVGVGYTAEVSNVSEGSSIYESPDIFKSGQSETLWFVSHDGDGNLVCGSEPCTKFNGVNPLRMNICWGSAGTANNNSQTPALEVMIYYDNSPGSSLGVSPNFQNVRISRSVYDPNTTRAASNNFTAATLGCGFDADYAFNTGVAYLNGIYAIQDSCLQNVGCLLFAKLKMIYNTTTGHPITAHMVNGSLPGQALQVESRGTVGAETQSVIEATRSYREVPSIFESAVFSMGSGANLNKN